jgi:hypothetical protein
METIGIQQVFRVNSPKANRKNNNSRYTKSRKLLFYPAQNKLVKQALVNRIIFCRALAGVAG